MIRFKVFLFILTFGMSNALLLGEELTLHTLYGPVTVSNPLILELLKTPSIERLKHIDQHGIHYFRKNHPTFTRYDHSIGVYYLLERFHVPLIEQAAGLIHDISHTAFSHLSDVIYNHDDKLLGYQDSIHYWYLEKCKYGSIAQQYNYTLNDLLFKANQYTALESPLPDLCADRLEYNLHTGYVFQMISHKEISEILDDLSFDQNRWFFNTVSMAKKFASLSLYFTEHFWGSAWENAIYKLAATAFQRGLALKIIDFDDLHFSTDAAILHKLYAAQDPTIQKILDQCSHYMSHYRLGSAEHHDYFIIPKFRGINPWVRVGSDFVRLTSLDLEFALEYLRVKEVMKQGHYLIIE